MFQRALDGYKNTMGPGHKWTLEAIDDLAKLYRKRGKLEQAESLELAPWS